MLAVFGGFLVAVGMFIASYLSAILLGPIAGFFWYLAGLMYVFKSSEKSQEKGPRLAYRCSYVFFIIPLLGLLIWSVIKYGLAPVGGLW